MAITLGRDFVSIDNVRWREIGLTFMGVLVDMKQRQRRKQNPTTKQWEPEWKDAEKTIPRNELVLTLLALAEHTTTPVGTERTGDKAVEDLQLVQWTISGKLWSQWIEAERALGRSIQVGDIVYGVQFGCVFYRPDGSVISTTTDQNEVNATRMKAGAPTIGADIELSLRAPGPSEMGLVDLAEREYMKRQERIQLGDGQQEQRAPVQSSTPAPAAAPATTPPPATSARKFI